MNIHPHKKFLLLLAKAAVVVLTLYLLVAAVQNAPDSVGSWRDTLYQAMAGPKRLLLLLVALLMPVNWGFEARKWQLLGQKLEPLSFWRAYRAVMVGLTLGFITPNRLGDYAGRVLELKSRQRLEAVGAIFIGRFCQLVATVLAGSLGLLYFILAFMWHPYPAVALSLLFLLLTLSVFMLLLLYHANAMVAVVAAVKPLRKVVPYLALMGSYTSKETTRLLWLSLGRYAVFLGQFVLLLLLFGVELQPLQYITGVAGTFFLKSVVPSVSLLSDLGVRELSAMYLFGLLGQARLPVLSASLCLWLLNIAIPSVLGLYFVLRLRLARKGVAA